jgi:hypothetical protein
MTQFLNESIHKNIKEVLAFVHVSNVMILINMLRVIHLVTSLIYSFFHILNLFKHV